MPGDVLAEYVARYLLEEEASAGVGVVHDRRVVIKIEEHLLPAAAAAAAAADRCTAGARRVGQLGVSGVSRLARSGAQGCIPVAYSSI